MLCIVHISVIIWAMTITKEAAKIKQITKVMFSCEKLDVFLSKLGHHEVLSQTTQQSI